MRTFFFKFVFIIFALSSTLALAEGPTAMGLVIRHNADYACEGRGAKAKGVYVLLWKRPRSPGYTAEVRIGSTSRTYVFDSVYTGAWSERNRYSSSIMFTPILYIDERQDSRFIKTVAGPYGARFKRWESADLSISASPYDTYYSMTCYSRLVD